MLDALELLLHYKLSAVCGKLRNGLPGLPASDGAAAQYEYTALRAKGLLFLRAAEPAGGFDRRVSIVLAEHRQKDDRSWEGQMCYQNQMLVALSRASARCYVLAEDLRGEVTVPRGVPNGTAPGRDCCTYQIASADICCRY